MEQPDGERGRLDFAGFPFQKIAKLKKQLPVYILMIRGRRGHHVERPVYKFDPYAFIKFKPIRVCVILIFKTVIQKVRRHDMHPSQSVSVAHGKIQNHVRRLPHAGPFCAVKTSGNGLRLFQNQITAVMYNENLKLLNYAPQSVRGREEII
jgi:hypothetical protein